MKEWHDSMLAEPPKTPKKVHNKNASKVSLESLDDIEAQKEIIKPSRSKEGRRTRNEPTTCSCDSPLKWTNTTKNLAFISILLTTASIGMLKTLFITVNSVLATEFSVSYTGATAATGAPLIIGGVTGLGARMLATSIGKRPIYLFSSIIMLGATLWSMHVYSNYGAFISSRIFQGVGWGAMEGLMAESFNDMFSPQQRNFRASINTFVSWFFMLGTPIVGGYLSQSTQGYRNQIMIINIFQAFSILTLILFHPETTYHHSHNTPPPNIASTFAVTTTTTITAAPLSPLKTYLKTLSLTNQNSTRKPTVSKMLSPLKSLLTPSTLLTTLLTAPLLATSLGMLQSLSLLFTTMPTFLFPSRLGYLLSFPLVLTSILYPLTKTTSYYLSRASKKPTALTTSLPGLLISITGLLTFSLYTCNSLSSASSTTSIISSPTTTISLRLLSFLLSLLISGSIILSTASSALPTNLKDGHHVLQEVIVGIWIICMPMWLRDQESGMLEQVRSVGIVSSVLIVVLGSTSAAVLWGKGEKVRMVDGKVLGGEKKTGRREKRGVV